MIINTSPNQLCKLGLNGIDEHIASSEICVSIVSNKHKTGELFDFVPHVFVFAIVFALATPSKIAVM